jgi:hypothetical protein
MQKSLVLLATIAVAGTQAYLTSDARMRLANDFTVHSIDLDEVRAKHGMRPLEYHHASNKKALMSSAHQVEQCSMSSIDVLSEGFECARGFAYGLQFSPMK